MAYRVNNDPRRFRSVEDHIRVRTYHKAAKLVLVGGISTIGMISEYINYVL